MKQRFKIILFFITVAFIAISAISIHKALNNEDTDWANYGGDSGGSRYSSLSQINTSNVKSLKVAWEYDTGEEVDLKRPMATQCQPIVIDGILYGTSSKHKLFAINADSGAAIWQYDPYEDSQLSPRYHPMRGLCFWQKNGNKRILYTVGDQLIAIDAKTGKLILDFGKNGYVDLHQGLGDEATLGYDVNQFSIRSTSPGVIFKDLIILGSATSEGGDALPGNIRAFNVVTGKLEWVFRTIPLPGEYGYETWAKDSYKKLGGANCWAGLVVDKERGMVFLGTGSPSVDFYGGARHGQNLFANCVIALNAETGERKWHFQTVHHDLWDKDIPCPPNLITVTHKGKKIDAVAQATKDGYVFIFDRDTGEPLFPVNEIKVPTSPALLGEQPWPTQPIPSLPKPFAFQKVNKKTLTNRTPAARKYVLERFENSSSGNKYLPPSEKGTLYLGFGGGAEWGGAATDPSGIFYVNGNNMLWWLQMRKANTENESKGAKLFAQNCSACHETKIPQSKNQTYPSLYEVGKRMSSAQILTLLDNGRGRMPAFNYIKTEDKSAIVDFLLGKIPEEDQHIIKTFEKQDSKLFPYNPPFLNNGTSQFLDHEGFPATRTPWGTLNAIDMNTGKYLWKKTLGEFPEMTKKGIKPTGTENHGGPIVTAGGLLFIAATYDEKLRAFDQKNGRQLWESKLPAGGFSTPITYSVKGKQYVVIACGGARYGLKGGSKYVAYALP